MTDSHLAAANERLDSLIADTAAELARMRQTGLSAGEVLGLLIGSFIAEASGETAAAGAAGHAMALYRCCENTARIKELEEAVAFRDAVIVNISSLEDL